MKHRVISSTLPEHPQPGDILAVLARTHMPAGPFAEPQTMYRSVSGRGKLHKSWCARVKYDVVPVEINVLTIDAPSCSECYIDTFGARAPYLTALADVERVILNLDAIEAAHGRGYYTATDRLAVAAWLTDDRWVPRWLEESRHLVAHAQQQWPQFAAGLTEAYPAIDAVAQRAEALVQALTERAPCQDLLIEELARKVAANSMYAWLHERKDDELGADVADLLFAFVRDWASQRDAMLYLQDSASRLVTGVNDTSFPGPWITAPQGSNAYEWIAAEFHARVEKHHAQLLIELEFAHNRALQTARENVSVVFTATGTQPEVQMREHRGANTLLDAGVIIAPGGRTWYGRVPRIAAEWARSNQDSHAVSLVAVGDWDEETMRVAAGLLDTQRPQDQDEFEQLLLVAQAVAH